MNPERGQESTVERYEAVWVGRSGFGWGIQREFQKAQLNSKRQSGWGGVCLVGNPGRGQENKVERYEAV